VTVDIERELAQFGRYLDTAQQPIAIEDLVGLLAREAKPERAHGRQDRRWWAVAVAVAMLLIGGLVAIAAARRDRPERIPADFTPVTTLPTATATANGWVVFSGSDDSDDYDLFVVRDGLPVDRIVGSATDRVEETCPAFSPDGRRLAWGRAARNLDDGYSNAELGIADLNVDGTIARTITIPLEGDLLPPCANWSPDGRWLAFGVQSQAFWLVDATTGEIRQIADVTVSDLEWRPDGTELTVADGGISTYSVEGDDLNRVGETTGVGSVAWSPDGSRLAYQRVVTGSTADMEIWVMNADGTDEHLVASDFRSIHGIGPVWSPDGDRIVYQRVCSMRANASLVCREEHEAVVLDVPQTGFDRGTPAAIVVPPPETIGPDGPLWWYPFSVTWSPDGTALLYVAWSLGDKTSDVGVVVVPLDDPTSPVVLSDGIDVRVYSEFPWLPLQTWVASADR
jgi:Tol biopolymer transport system component